MYIYNIYVTLHTFYRGWGSSCQAMRMFVCVLSKHLEYHTSCRITPANFQSFIVFCTLNRKSAAKSAKSIIVVQWHYCCCKSFWDDHAQHTHYRARCFIRSWNVHPLYAWCLNKTRPKNICICICIWGTRMYHAQYTHYRARYFIRSWNVHPMYAWCLNKTCPKNICICICIWGTRMYTQWSVGPPGNLRCTVTLSAKAYLLEGHKKKLPE